MIKKEDSLKWIIFFAIMIVVILIVNVIQFNLLYDFYKKNANLEGELASMDSGADVMKISKKNAICRIIGEDVQSGRDIVSCFYGIRADATRNPYGGEITNVKILAFEELYYGGTFVDGIYQYDGEFIGKYRKDFLYNDNADVFWKVEVGLNGSTLEFCSMRDQEYADTARTKETCQSLNIDIQ